MIRCVDLWCRVIRVFLLILDFFIINMSCFNSIRGYMRKNIKRLKKDAKTYGKL